MMNQMNNPIMMDLLALKQQGVNPSEAMRRLAQKYPAFQRAMPMIQNLNAQELTMAAQSTAQHMGIDPGKVATQALGYLKE